MPPVTTAVVLIFRLRLLLFFESIWLPNARRRVSLPVLVSLMRLAVPLWVFIFGILLTPYYDAQVPTCHHWFLFEYCIILEKVYDSFYKLVA